MTDYTTKAARDALMGSIAAEYYLAAVPPSEARLLAAVRNLKDACDKLEARAEAAERERDEALERAKLYDMGVCPNLAHLNLEERIAALERERDEHKLAFEQGYEMTKAMGERIAAMEKALRDALERYQAVIESEWSPGFTDAQWKKEPEVADLWAVLEGKP